MKNYKFILVVVTLLVVSLIFIITSLEMPAPYKEVIKSLDVNDVSVK